jgi:hypothetical protein
LIDDFELFLFIKHLCELFEEYILFESPILREVILNEIKLFVEIIILESVFFSNNRNKVFIHTMGQK